jgi:subtilase family serine protease
MLRMDRAGWQRRLAGLLVIALLVLAMASAAGAGTPRTGVAAGRFRPAFGTQPHWQNVGKPSAASGQVVFDCQRPSADFKCYGPEQIRHAYGFDQLISKGVTARGRSIVIVDAFQSPTLRQDLALFNKVFGLPSAPLHIFAPQGLPPFDPNDPNQVGWSGEISLDVEWAHAVAPKATINLVLARSDSEVDIPAAVAYAVDHNLGDVISMSFGQLEDCLGPASLRAIGATFKRATAKGTSLFASSGDFGSTQPDCTTDGLRFGVGYPASDPLVSGVGGTILYANLRTGAYNSERAWKETLDGQVIGTGGGFSRVYGTPRYQRPLHLPSRGVPDVAYSAGVNRGVLVAWGVPDGVGEFFVFGGTSAGSPQWAGLTALADQLAGHRLGFLNPAIYAIARSSRYSKTFHDITKGNNREPGFPGYSAGTGWDPTTGWGTPKANNLVPTLAAAAG